MNILSRKATPEPEEPAITGNDILRKHLKHYMTRPGLSLVDVARHINEDYAAASNRSTVNGIAARLAGDAGDIVARRLTTTLLGSIGSDTESSAIINPQQLEDFAAGKTDLSNEVKSLLAAYFHDGRAVYDPDSGLLKYPDAPPYAAPLNAPRLPEKWRHPSPKVAAAWDNYQSALREYNGPPPARTTPITGLPGEPAKLKPRPGWKA